MEEVVTYIEVLSRHCRKKFLSGGGSKRIERNTERQTSQLCRQVLFVLHTILNHNGELDRFFSQRLLWVWVGG
jgi:hypothetical protein